MWKKLSLIAVAVLALGVTPRSHAGTEMVEPERTPAPRYNYTPPPPPRVYYAPPRVRVVVYPSFGYCGPVFRGYGYGGFCGRRVFWHGRWR